MGEYRGLPSIELSKWGKPGRILAYFLFRHQRMSQFDKQNVPLWERNYYILLTPFARKPSC